MPQQFTIEEGLATLTDQERRFYDALCCEDIVVDVEVKWAKELNNFQRRKPANRTPEMEDRLNRAGRSIGPFGNAMHPTVVLGMWQQVMFLRCQRDALAKASADYLRSGDDRRGGYPSIPNETPAPAIAEEALIELLEKVGHGPQHA